MILDISGSVIFRRALKKYLDEIEEGLEHDEVERLVSGFTNGWIASKEHTLSVLESFTKDETDGE